jgi:flagellar M-ring protein FliF
MSSSVPNLSPKKVTIVDGNGQMLTSIEDEGAGDVAAFRKKQDLEKSYERKVKSLLEPIIGFGKVQVKVTADLDFTVKETTEEKFDPESVAVRSEKKSKTKETSSSSNSGGTVGPGAQGGTQAGPGKDRSDQSEQVEYEISKQVQKIVNPVGEIKKLSIAVVVDGKYETAAEGEEPKYVARTAEEMKNYEDLVKSAIGFNDTRGDQLKVMNLAFQSLDQLFAASASDSVWQKMFNDRTTYTFYINVLVNIVIAVIAILIALVLVRPVVMAWLSRRQQDAQLALAAAQGQGKGGALTAGDVRMRENIQQQSLEDPDNMVKILRSWLE